MPANKMPTIIIPEKAMPDTAMPDTAMPDSRLSDNSNEPKPPPLNIVVAEDAAILRDGLVELLQRRGHNAVGVPDGEALRKYIERQYATNNSELPDVIVADIRMPPTHTDEGLQAALKLRATYPGLPVLLFSQYIEAAYATELVADGVGGVGYLLKERVGAVRDFIDALQRVAAGQTVLDPLVVAQLVGASRQDRGIASLTPREREVLDLMAQGRSNGAISRTLYISAPTVEKNIAAIFHKLGLENTGDDHRRVLAVLRYLNASTAAG